MPTMEFDQVNLTVSNDELLDEMLGLARRAVSYANEIADAGGEPDPSRIDALSFCMAAMGETGSSVSDYITNLMSPVPWEELAELRQKVLQGHRDKDGVRNMVEIAQRDLPPAISVLEGWTVAA